jgi:hypothetical protein
MKKADKPEALASTTQIVLTIKAGTALSQAVACPNGAVTRVWMPSSGWDGGQITFQLSYDGVTFYDLFDEKNNEMTWNLTVGAVSYTMLTFPVANNLFMKVRSGVRKAPINQTEDRHFKIDII